MATKRERIEKEVRSHWGQTDFKIVCDGIENLIDEFLEEQAEEMFYSEKEQDEKK